jgi:hypothetical protein
MGTKSDYPGFQNTIQDVVWWAVNKALETLPTDSEKNSLFNLFYPLSGSVRGFDELDLDSRFKHWLLYGGYSFETAASLSGLSKEEALKQMYKILVFYDAQITFATKCFVISENSRAHEDNTEALLALGGLQTLANMCEKYNEVRKEKEGTNHDKNELGTADGSSDK